MNNKMAYGIGVGFFQVLHYLGIYAINILVKYLKLKLLKII